MKLLKSVKAGLFQLGKIATTAVRYAARESTREQRSRNEESYLLHPRCCRTERYF